MRTSDITTVPLFVRENGDLIINYKYLEKFLYDKNVIFDIRYGVKSSGYTGGSDSFESKDVRIHVGGTTLTGKIVDENRDTVRSLHIKSEDWRQLAFTQVRLYNKKENKEVTHDET